MAESFLEGIRRAGREAAAREAAQVAPKKPAAKKPAPKKPVAKKRAPAPRRPLGPAVPANVQRRNVSAYRERKAADAELAKINAPYLAQPAATRPRAATAGVDPSVLNRLQLLNQGAGAGGNWLTGLVQNAGREGLNILTSVPSQAQLLAENAAAVPVAPLAYASRAGAPGVGWAENYQNRVFNMDKAAVQNQLADWRHRYGPVWDVSAIDVARDTDGARGKLRTYGERAYEQPLSTALDILGAKSAIGRGPNYAARAVRAVAPGSRAAAAATRSLSGLPAADRLAINAAENARRAKARAFSPSARPKRSLREVPFAPGEGGLRRPPRVVRSTIADDNGRPSVVGAREIAVEQNPYSGDRFAQARQRAVDRFREGTGRRLEERANRAQIVNPVERRPKRAALKRTVLSPLTTEAKYARYQRKNARAMADVAHQAAGALTDRNSKGLARALVRLKKDKSAAGIPIKSRISSEEMAVTMHWDDQLSPRGGLTPVQLRDRVVARHEGQIAANRRDGIPTAEAEAQVTAMRRIPQELLDLTDDANPAVQRVRAAIEEGRKVDAANQAQSVAAGVVTPETAQAVKGRASAITLGGSRWWQDAVREVHRDFNPKIQGLRKRVAAERAAAQEARAAGNTDLAARHYSAVRQLETTLKGRIAARQAKVAKIKAGATTETPRLVQARKAFAESNTRMSEAAQTGSAREIQSTTRARDTYRKRLRKMEQESLGFTAPRRPELVGSRGVYRPERSIRPNARQTGPRTGRIGADQARQSHGVLRAGAEFDMHPRTMLDQVARAAENYKGKRSPAATAELIDSIAYYGPDGKTFLTGNSKALSRVSDLSRVSFINRTKLDAALKALDDLPEGKWLDKDTAADVFTDRIPEGARKGDYIAVHRDAKDVWTETMTSNTYLKAWDTGLTYWKGGLLALSPRWYLNNTVGLALQYGLLGGGDLRSIFRGNRKGIRQAMENRAAHIARDTLANEAQGSSKLIRPIRKGFEINARLEEVWRRAAYANRAKRLLGNEGVKVGKLTDADFARALETMPESAVRQIVRDVDYFVGDYRKFSMVERDIIKRVVPFYSWIRVIGRLTFGLPFRSPLRAYALATLGKAAAAGLDPYGYQLPWYERSSVMVGDTRVGVSSANPAATLGGFVAALGAKNPLMAEVGEATGFLHPLLSAFVNYQTGRNSFGNVVQPGPGDASFGKDPQSFNRVTGRVETQPAGVPPAEAILQLIAPGQASIARKVLAGNRSPRDTASTPQIVADFVNRKKGGKRDESLYWPAKKGQQPKTPYVFTPALSAFLGISPSKQDPAVIAKRARDDLRRFEVEQRKLAIKKRTAKR